MDPTPLPFQITHGPVLRSLDVDADALYAFLDAVEEGSPAPETVVAASAAVAEILSRGKPAAARLIERTEETAVVCVRYGPAVGEIVRFRLSICGIWITSEVCWEDLIAVILPVDAHLAEMAPDLEPSFRDASGASTFACVFPALLGVGGEGALASQIPEQAWVGLEDTPNVLSARRGFAPRSGHPLESHQAGPLEGSSSRFAPGQRVGNYELRARLGRGSMGEVWRAEGPDGPVAVKLALRPSFVRHLRQEGLLLAKVEHSHVARFISADLNHEPPYLVTELVAGQPLRVQCRGKLPPSNVVLLCDQLLGGLQAIHDAGVLHLDLKPENVIVQPGGGVKIVDLGLGRATTRFMEEVYLSVSLVSRAPPVAGTLAYMSPEQRKGRELGPRSDLFAFGILLHELLTGELPEPGVAVSDRRPELAPRWDVVIARLTHPDPSKRPESAADARLLVCYTLSEKLRRPVPRGGVRPRDLKSFDETTFALASPFVPGQVIGDGYELVSPLGRGGFGEVWRARRGGGEDNTLEEVALKLILTEDAREGLEKEADVAARIQHRNVPSLIGNHCHEDPPHLVFDLVQGDSLRLLINEREEPFELSEALAIFASQVEVVAACAAADVVHMDLKPEHFLVRHEQDRAPEVTLIDFGLAALLDRSSLHDSLASINEVRGTLDYMAPEQREGQAGPEVDVFALGVCLFELLTLSLPKGTQGIRSIRKGVPVALDSLCLSMLARDRSSRPSIEDVGEAIRALRFEPSGQAVVAETGRAVSVWAQLAHSLRGSARSLVGKKWFVVAIFPLVLGLLAYASGAFTIEERWARKPDPTQKSSGDKKTPLNLGQLQAQVAAVASDSAEAHRLYVRALEGGHRVRSYGRRLAREGRSAALAERIVGRLLETRDHDGPLGGALVDQREFGFRPLLTLRASRPRLASTIYLRLALFPKTRVGALKGVVWALTAGPPEARRDPGEFERLARRGLQGRLRADPTQLRPEARALNRFLLSAAPTAQLRAAAFLRAVLGPEADGQVDGLQAHVRQDWGRAAAKLFLDGVAREARPKGYPPKVLRGFAILRDQVGG